MATSVVQSGDYLLELDTGFQVDAFLLDDALKGVIGNTDYVLDGTTQFADITPFVTDIRYKRGRQRTDYQFGAGTMSFNMLDETGILGPYDTSSPYYDPANNEPGLAPLRKIRLSRDGTYLFTGIVTGYDYNFVLGDLDSVTVICADDFYRLAQTQLDTYNTTAELSGSRVTNVLDLPEVDYPAGTRSIATGTVELGGTGQYNVDAGTNTLGYLQQINEAEQGRLFMAADGTLTFENRIGQTLSGSVVSFKDDGTGAGYTDVTIQFDADRVVNRAYVEPLSGSSATATDNTSITKYFIQSRSITNSLLHISGEITALANYLLEPDPEPQYTSVTTTFSRLTSSQRDDVASVDIGDTISIEKQIPGLNSQIAEELAVEGIEGRITVSGGHVITFFTSATTIVYELILDDLLYGLINDTNVLG
jgi:hypothetical protein